MRRLDALGVGIGQGQGQGGENDGDQEHRRPQGKHGRSCRKGGGPTGGRGPGQEAVGQCRAVAQSPETRQLELLSNCYVSWDPFFFFFFFLREDLAMWFRLPLDSWCNLG